MKIFCDFDGTLNDMSARHYRVYSEVTQMFGGIPLGQTDYWDMKRKKTKWDELLLLSGLSADIERDYLAHFIPKIENVDYLHEDVLFPGAKEALDALAELSDQRYLVSLRRRPENLKCQLRWMHVEYYFTEILSGHSENDGYDVKIALIKTRLGGDRGVIIGDTEADIITGTQLGLTTVAVCSGIRDKQFLLALRPNYLLESIADLPDALKTI